MAPQLPNAQRGDRISQMIPTCTCTQRLTLIASIQVLNDAATGDFSSFVATRVARRLVDMSSLKFPCSSGHRHSPAVLRGLRGECKQPKIQKPSRSVLVLAEGRKSSAEVAKTVTSLVSYGTLCTSTDDGLPLGTFVTFVLDDQGCPLLRLRKDAVHTNNLQARSQCTLFAHAAEAPARNLARVTLLGAVESLEEEESRQAAARHADIYRDAVGVDAPDPDDTFMRLKDPVAEQISGEEYCNAEPDELSDVASRLVHMYNTQREDDVKNVAAAVMGASSDAILSAEFLWIDTKGVDFKAEALGGLSQTGRYSFARDAMDELDALSLITMAAQVAWENERSYTPTVPTPASEPATAE